jgi:hypothetical protein
MPIASLDEIRAKVGLPVGVSDWIEVGQDRISQFADATDDHQFIHVDPAAAAAAGFGGTIAHGFLTLSLQPNGGGRNADPSTIRWPSIRVDRFASLPRSRREHVCSHFTLKAPRKRRLANCFETPGHGRDRGAGETRLTAQWLGLIFT